MLFPSSYLDSSLISFHCIYFPQSSNRDSTRNSYSNSPASAAASLLTIVWKLVAFGIAGEVWACREGYLGTCSAFQRCFSSDSSRTKMKNMLINFKNLNATALTSDSLLPLIVPPDCNIAPLFVVLSFDSNLTSGSTLTGFASACFSLYLLN